MCKDCNENEQMKKGIDGEMVLLMSEKVGGIERSMIIIIIIELMMILVEVIGQRRII